jgi:site-specific recombinase XerD
MDKAQKEKLIKLDYDLALIKKPKIPKREVDYLTEEEIEIFTGTIEDDIKKGRAIRKVRMMALVNFLLQTGARIGEALSINKDEIDRQNLEISIIGKGNKERPLFLDKQTLYWIDEYLSLRKDTNEALFVSLSGKSRWEQTDVGRSFRRYVEMSGIRKHFTLHTMRHTFATQYLMKGAGINVVQTALGHSDAVTTLKYYAGAVNRAKVKEMICDRHFNFISRTTMLCYGTFNPKDEIQSLETPSL